MAYVEAYKPRTTIAQEPTCWRGLDPKDAVKFLVCNTHIGTANADFQSEQYVYKRTDDGYHLINLGYTWHKLGLAARAIAAVEDPADVCVVSSRPQVQRALLKFAAHTGATPIVGRFVPGSFTNQIQKKCYKEPRLIIVSDPRADQQAVLEASYVNIPVVAFTNIDTPLKYIDIAIPCNNKSPESVGLMWWMLAREVLKLKENIYIDDTYFMLGDRMIMPDLYFFRDPEEQKKEEEEAKREQEAQMLATASKIVLDKHGEIKFHDEELHEWAVLEPEETNVVEPPQQQQQTEKVGEDGDDW